MILRRHFPIALAALIQRMVSVKRNLIWNQIVEDTEASNVHLQVLQDFLAKYQRTPDGSIPLDARVFSAIDGVEITTEKLLKDIRALRRALA